MEKARQDGSIKQRAATFVGYEALVGNERKITALGEYKRNLRAMPDDVKACLF
ncbi:MAG: hypothetical protein ACYC2R_08645 [Burkholderiales bacterium]